jgi:hypothetical protein
MKHQLLEAVNLKTSIKIGFWRFEVGIAWSKLAPLIHVKKAGK